MAIGPNELFKLAEELLESPDEVKLRASASRSFYAAFFVIKPLFDELYDGPELKAGTHEIIIDFFGLYQGDFGAEFSRKINQIGTAFAGLRILRTTADYDTVTKKFTRIQAEMALKAAQKIELCVNEAYDLRSKASE